MHAVPFGIVLPEPRQALAATTANPTNSRIRQECTSRDAVRITLPKVPLWVHYVVRFTMLGIGFTFATYGLLTWREQGFSLAGVWLYDNDWRLHPLHFLIFGIGVIPPAIWEIFMLEVVLAARRQAKAQRESETAG